MSIVLSQSRSQNQTLYSALKKSLRGKKAKRRREFNGSMTISKNLERKVIRRRLKRQVKRGRLKRKVKRRRLKRKAKQEGRRRNHQEKKGQKNPKDQKKIFSDHGDEPTGNIVRKVDKIVKKSLYNRMISQSF